MRIFNKKKIEINLNSFEIIYTYKKKLIYVKYLLVVFAHTHDRPSVKAVSLPISNAAVWFAKILFNNAVIMQYFFLFFSFFFLCFFNTTFPRIVCCFAEFYSAEVVEMLALLSIFFSQLFSFFFSVIMLYDTFVIVFLIFLCVFFFVFFCLFFCKWLPSCSFI